MHIYTLRICIYRLYNILHIPIPITNEKIMEFPGENGKGYRFLPKLFQLPSALLKMAPLGQ